MKVSSHIEIRSMTYRRNYFAGKGLGPILPKLRRRTSILLSTIQTNTVRVRLARNLPWSKVWIFSGGTSPNKAIDVVRSQSAIFRSWGMKPLYRLLRLH